MSLNNSNLQSLVKKLLFYKIQANIKGFSNLILAQVLALIFTIAGTNSWMTSVNNISIHAIGYSTDIIFIFTCIWCFIMCIKYANPDFKNNDFTFSVNRQAHLFSTILFILWQSFVASILAIGTNIFARVILFFLIKGDIFYWNYFSISFLEFFQNLFTIFFYLLLICSFGYLIGTLIQFYRPAMFLIPVLIVGILITEHSSLNTTQLILFFAHEASMFLFILKTIATSGIFYCFIYMMTIRMEVHSS